MNKTEAIEWLSRIADEPGPPTAHINKQLLRQLLEPIASLTPAVEAPAPHQGCPCESCKGLGQVPAAEFVSLLGEQVDSEAADSLRTRDAAIASAAYERGRQSVVAPVVEGVETSYVVPGKTLRHLAAGCELFRELLEGDEDIRELIDVEIEWLTAARESRPFQEQPFDRAAIATAADRAGRLALLDELEAAALKEYREQSAGNPQCTTNTSKSALAAGCFRQVLDDARAKLTSAPVGEQKETPHG